MISEREELTFKNGATIVLSRGEDGYTVNITGFDKPMIGTYTDIVDLTYDVGKYLKRNYHAAFVEDFFKSEVPEQERDLFKLAIRLRRIEPKWIKPQYLNWLHGV